MSASYASELRRMGRQIVQAIEASQRRALTTDFYLEEIAGTVFTPPLRAAMICSSRIARCAR